jgi:hypothetical protein
VAGSSGTDHHDTTEEPPMTATTTTTTCRFCGTGIVPTVPGDGDWRDPSQPESVSFLCRESPVSVLYHRPWTPTALPEHLTAALPTYDVLGETVTFKPVRVSVNVEVIAYVPVEHPDLVGRIAYEVRDAVVYRAPSHTDVEDHDALLVIDESEVSVFSVTDVDPSRALSTENLRSLVEGRAGEL